MSWLRMLGVVIGLELRLRVRSVAWYVLLGIVAVVIGAVTLVLFTALGTWEREVGAVLFSVVIFFVLLVTTLVTPALSGNAVNGDREAGVLAPTQLTQVTTTQLVLGKVLGAWIASLGFLAVSAPFLIGSALAGGLRMEAVLVSLPILVVEIGVIAAIGVGLSGVLRRPIFSTVVSYLVIASLSIGSLLAFFIVGVAVQSTEMVRHTQYDYNGNTSECTLSEPIETTRPRPDRVWWLLAANPYVVLADAIPPASDTYGTPQDAFTAISYGVRYAQLPPAEPTCDFESTAPDPFDGTVPAWPIGLAMHLLLAGGAVAGAIAATKAPARALAPGSRIA